MQQFEMMSCRNSDSEQASDVIEIKEEEFEESTSLNFIEISDEDLIKETHLMLSKGSKKITKI